MWKAYLSYSAEVPGEVEDLAADLGSDIERAEMDDTAGEWRHVTFLLLKVRH
jgi:hypothetical protein